MSDINEQYLNRLYEDLAKEQQRIMGSLKSSLIEETTKEQDITKQLTLLNTLMMNCMKYRNLQKKIASKGNII